jgi:hypothetical protein
MEKPQLADIGMAVSALGQNIGMFVGPVLFGWLLYDSFMRGGLNHRAFCKNQVASRAIR